MSDLLTAIEPVNALATMPEIAPGLSSLPRAIGSFSEFRAALLAGVRDPSRQALARFRARHDDDLGVMMLEWFAYLADVSAFYDARIADESYLRTAALRPSLRKLVAVLGYLPRPAVSSQVYLALEAEGRQPISVGAGAGFRSAGFDEEPPQVFELSAVQNVHPRVGPYTLETPIPSTPGEANANGGSLNTTESIVVEPDTLQVAVGDDILVIVTKSGSDSISTRRITAIEDAPAQDGATYSRLLLADAITALLDTDITALEILVPTRRIGLWAGSDFSANPDVVTNFSSSGTSHVILDGLHREMGTGDRLLIANGDDVRPFVVYSISERSMQLTSSTAFLAADTDGNAVELEGTAAFGPATRIRLDAAVNSSGRKTAGAADWDSGDVSSLTVHIGFRTAAEPVFLTSPVAIPGFALQIRSTRTKPLEIPDDVETPSRLLLVDHNDLGFDVEAAVDLSARTVDLVGDLDPAPAQPIVAHANIAHATRGESVTGEIIGVGDASIANLTCTLKNTPLTYVSSETATDDRGVVTTLEVFVDGIRWEEVPSLALAGPEDEVYAVRHDDDENTYVLFGDGDDHGSRTPTGAPIRVNYRFGAGAAVPPAGSITQAATPIEGVNAIINPLPAFGGDDRESEGELRTSAPASALLLGRAVSVLDVLAATESVAGVSAAQCEWQWSANRQTPVIRVWFLGDEALAPTVTSTLRGLMAASTIIEVTAAEAVPLDLALTIEPNPRAISDDVVADVEQILLAEPDGFLLPENLGIGQPFLRSVLSARVLSVSTVVALTEVMRDGMALTGLGITPGAGRYFDAVTAGSVSVYAKESTDG